MKFAKLAEYLEKLEGTSSRLAMTEILAQLYKEADSDEMREVVYLCQGKLGPAYKSPDFGVADKMMLRALGEKATELFKKYGDLGLVVERLKTEKTKDQINTKGLNVKQVYDKLWEIAEAGGLGSQEKKIMLICELVNQLDPVGAKFAVKMILGKLRSGFSDMTVLDGLSWMLTGGKSLRAKIEGLYDVRADLGELAKKIKENGGIDGLKVEPVVGTPILMAKAERATTAQEIWDREARAMEYKLDGLRIQAHIKPKGSLDSARDDNRVILFSRGMEDVTSMYPDIVEGLAKQIKKDCIVEGEMIALGKKGEFLPFQETTQRKRKYDIDEMRDKIPLTIFLFDVLVVEKRNVMGERNEDRRKMLEELVTGSGNVKLITRKTAKNVSDIEDFYKQAIEDRTEGIMVKRLSGPYKPGSRDFNWIKYKKSYDKSALLDTIDAVVMGYDVGQGKRTAFGIGDFLIGVYEPKSEKYKTIAKIGTGLTDEEWKRIKTTVDQYSSFSVMPESYEVSKVMNCDVWVKPKLVVEILADEITKSPMHSSGLALRFPRLISFREKKPEDATTTDELRILFDKQRGEG